MALIVIQIQDNPNGTAMVRLSTEPVMSEGQLADSTAQKMAVIALDAIHDAMEKDKPRIQIVSADSIPH